MKKLIYFFTVTAALAFAAGCAREADFDPVEGELVETTFTVALDDATATKAAIGNEADYIDKLVVRAFKKSDGTSLNALDENFTIEPVATNNQNQKQFAVKAKLVRNFDYTIGFFAYHDGAPYAIDDAGDITLTPVAATLANDETLDAFYAAVDVKLDPDTPASMSRSVTLTRPLAQVNILSDPADWAAATTSGITADALQSSVSIAGAPNKLSLLDGSVSGGVTLAYALNEIPGGTLNVAAPNATEVNAKYVAMAYVFADATGQNLNVTFSVPAISSVGFDGFTRTVNNMPVKRNFRTNLHGDLFTVSGDFTVTVDPSWGGNDNNQDINIPQPTVDPLALPANYQGNAVVPTVTTGNNVASQVGSNDLYFGLSTNSDGEITYTSTHPEVGTINSTGEFHPVSAGTTDIIVYQAAGTQTKTVGDPVAELTIVYHVTVAGAAKYGITKNTPENGTLVVKIGDDEVTEAEAGATITVVATPADGYQIATLTYTPAGEEPVVYNAPFSMPAKAVAVSASFEEIPPVAPVLQSIAITNLTKTSFTVGDKFAFDGTVTASYDTGGPHAVTENLAFVIDGNTIAYPGSTDMTYAMNGQNVVVSYTEGGVTQYATAYAITVNKKARTIAFASASTTVTTAQESITLPTLSATTGAMTANDAYEIVSNDEDVVAVMDDDDLTAALVIGDPGTAVITVSVVDTENEYADAQATFTITVKNPAPALSFINETSMTAGTPLTLEVNKGSSDGAVTYSIVTADTNAPGAAIDGSSLSATGAGTVKVRATLAETSTYLGTTADCTITVSAAATPTLTSITVENQKTVFTSKEKFSLNKASGPAATVTAHYSDDSTIDVTTSSSFEIGSTSLSIGSTDMLLTMGGQNVIVSYGGQTAQYAITVNLVIVLNEDTVPNGFPTSKTSDTSGTSYTWDGYSFVFCSAGSGNGYNWNSSSKYILNGKNGAYILLPAVNGMKLSNISFVAPSGASTSVQVAVKSADGSSSIKDATTLSSQGSDNPYSWNISGANNTSYRIQIVSAHNAQFQNLTLTYTKAE